MELHRRIHPSVLALSVAIAALAFAGCGSDDSSSGSSGSSYGSGASKPKDKTTSTAAAGSAAGGAVGSTAKTEADEEGELYFKPTKLAAKAGKVTVTMENPASSGVAHGIAVEGNGVDEDGEIVQAGGTSTVTADLKAGTYEFYCPVPSHKAAGMKGTLTVS